MKKRSIDSRGRLKCGKCKDFFNKDMFNKNSSTVRGYAYECKKCRRERIGSFSAVLDSIADYHAGKLLLKEVCAKHGDMPMHVATRMANKQVSIALSDTKYVAPGLDSDVIGDVYRTSRMTVEEYVAWLGVSGKKSLVEEEITDPMDEGTRKRVMEFINLQPA